MTHQDLLDKLRAHPRPVVVEFWAPWCIPCKRMAPDLEKTSREYEGRVDLWRYNADENPDLLRELGVLGIPTVLAYSGGAQVFRRTGAQSLPDLQSIFAATLAGQAAPRALSTTDRLLRVGSGAVLAAVAFFAGSAAWPLFIAAGLLLFSAVYDRCPVYQTLAPRVKALFSRR